MVDLVIVREILHEIYFASWQKVLKNEKSYIFKAAGAASKAYRYWGVQI